MKKAGIAIAALVVVILIGMAVYQQVRAPRAEGVAVLKPVELKLFTHLGSSTGTYAVGQPEKPGSRVALPGEVSETDQVVYFDLPIGQRSVAAITRINGQNNIALWVDINLDQHLSDETMLRGVTKQHRYSSSHTESYIEYGPIRLAGTDFTSAPFRLICEGTGHFIQIKPAAYYRGKVKLDGRVFTVAVVDNDLDGALATCFKPIADANQPCCDLIALDSDQSDWIFKDGLERHEIIPLGRYLKPLSHIDTYYAVTFLEKGRRLHLEPATPEFGTLKIAPNKKLRVQAFSDAATQQLEFTNEIDIPVGNYQLRYGRLTVTGENGRAYELAPTFLGDRRNGQFVIEAGQTVTLDPGPPFTVKTDIRYYGEDRLSINVDLVGREGETYGLRLPTSSGRPGLKILDETNAELHRGKMEYG